MLRHGITARGGGQPSWQSRGRQLGVGLRVQRLAGCNHHCRLGVFVCKAVIKITINNHHRDPFTPTLHVFASGVYGKWKRISRLPKHGPGIGQKAAGTALGGRDSAKQLGENREVNAVNKNAQLAGPKDALPFHSSGQMQMLPMFDEWSQGFACLRLGLGLRLGLTRVLRCAFKPKRMSSLCSQLPLFRTPLPFTSCPRCAYSGSVWVSVLHKEAVAFGVSTAIDSWPPNETFAATLTQLGRADSNHFVVLRN